MSETPTRVVVEPEPACIQRTVRLDLRAGDVSETHVVPTGASLLQIALEADTSLTFVCCRGVCGACLIRVANNEQNLSPRTEAEQELLSALDAPEDTRLACQCSILGDVAIELVDESEIT